MKHQLSLLSLFLLVETNVHAQQYINPSSASGDCIHAVEVTDTVVIAAASPTGYGNILEIEGNKKEDIYFFEREHNTIWYRFTAKADAELTFDIIPQYIHDDYDFSLYKFTGNNFCDDVKSKKVMPVRTCISRNDPVLLSMTGLESTATADFIHSGVGPSYSRALEVKKGEVYYLLVDNVYKNGRGHTIRFHYKVKEEPPAVVEPKRVPVETKKDTTHVAPSKEIVLEAGRSFTFSNIQFYGNEARFLPTAKPALDSLLAIMIDNPTLKIEIQGHVNGPFFNNSEWFQQLSEDRAKAVYEFLLSNTIASNRMQWKGYGNTNMLFPETNSEVEMQQNRRVEIKVLAK